MNRLGFSSSVLSLLAANAFTIAAALYEGWDLGVLMWIYCGQSIIIGLFSVLKILDLKRFSTEGFTMNGRAVGETPQTKRRVAVFFALHYGFFHFGYFIFLRIEDPLESTDMLWVGLCIAVYFANHYFSYLHNREHDAARIPNIGTMMFFPYARVVPLHLTIIFGSMLGPGRLLLLLFLGLKTVADLVMHAVEHREPAVSY